jgi:dTMP kinase
MLIVLDGVDGCGKGTQVELLKEQFPDAIVFKYPTMNFSLLNDYLEKKIELDPKALFLLFLSDIANEQESIKESLEEGKTVILDRYVYSTIAYELDSFTYGDAKRIVESIGFLRPDIVLLLDIPSEISQDRKKKQKSLDRYEEDMAYLEKVRENFLKLHGEGFLAGAWVKIDASKSVEEVHEEIKDALKE